MLIDAHQHFWKFDPVRDSWITDDMKVLQSDFLPAQLKPLLEQSGVDGSVLVQSDQSEDGNDFMISLSKDNDFIKGIVAWVDFRSKQLDARLAYYQQIPVVKGFRHILQGEPNRSLMLEPSFLEGIGKLKKYDYTYDILIYKDQLKYIPEFLRHFPDQRFVLDHMAKPDIRSKKIEDWRNEIIALAAFPNLSCKVSGMFTEADWHHWSYEDFKPYLDVVVDTFGTHRLMYGSDWPVCLVATSYHGQYSFIQNYFSSFSENERQMIFGRNASAFYNLK